MITVNSDGLKSFGNGFSSENPDEDTDFRLGVLPTLRLLHTLSLPEEQLSRCFRGWSGRDWPPDKDEVGNNGFTIDALPSGSC
jgi:hypothetical protein